MSTPPMLRQMRHDVWATGKLLERCRSLTTDELQLTAPGTYGSIQKTFAHIVRANEGYLNTYSVIPQPFIELTASVDEIASRLARVRDAVEQLFSRRTSTSIRRNTTSGARWIWSSGSRSLSSRTTEATTARRSGRS